MPHVLRGGDELRQDEGAGAEEALEREHAAPCRPEEQIVVEEAGVFSAVTGLANKNPCARSKPISRTAKKSAQVSTPSATVRAP
jgi:hypothetical protein